MIMPETRGSKRKRVTNSPLNSEQKRSKGLSYDQSDQAGTSRESLNSSIRSFSTSSASQSIPITPVPSISLDSQETDVNDVKQNGKAQNKRKNDKPLSLNSDIDSSSLDDLDSSYSKFSNDDDDDIPYTHSRSQSPVVLDEIDTNKKKDSGEIIDLDHEEDDYKEYYVISDEEEDEDDKESSQKSINQQLEEQSKNNGSNLNQVNCAVCFDKPERTFILPCGHVYCGDCVFKALSSTKQSTKNGGPCSLCRSYTPYKKIMMALFKQKRKVLT